MIMPAAGMVAGYLHTVLHTINGTKQRENAQIAKGRGKEKALKLLCFKALIGAPWGIRTLDLLIRREKAQNLETVMNKGFLLDRPDFAYRFAYQTRNISEFWPPPRVCVLGDRKCAGSSFRRRGPSK